MFFFLQKTSDLGFSLKLKLMARDFLGLGFLGFSNFGDSGVSGLGHVCKHSKFQYNFLMMID